MHVDLHRVYVHAAVDRRHPLHRQREQTLLWVVMITSAEKRPWPGDVPLGAGYRESGLPAPSVIRPCKIATIEARLAEPIGAVSPAVLRKVDAEVRRLLGFA